MAMSAKAQAKKILASKSFTGKQAAHLVLKDSVEGDHGRPGILTATEIQRLKQGLQGHEVDVYNSWVRAYQLVDYSTKEATIMALQVEKRLMSLYAPMVMASLGEGEMVHRAMSRPILATKKQLEDIEREHREEAANQLVEFSVVVVTAAEDLTKEAAQRYPEDAAGVIEDFLRWAEFTEEDALPSLSVKEAHALQDEIFKASALRLLEDIKAGKLTPFTLTKAELAKHASLQQAFREADANSPLAVQALSQKLKAYEAEVSLRAFERATAKKTAALVKKIQDGLEDGSITFQKEPEWLDAVFFRGQNLIEAGPAWYAWWADHFEANQYQGYALVLDPKPHQLDENGHFLEPKNALLPGSTREEAIKDLEDMAETLHEAIVKAHAVARKQLRHVLGYRAVIEAVSEAIGVDLAEDIELAWSSLTGTLDSHHELLERVSGWHRLEGLASLKLDIEALKPSQKTVNYIRERLSLTLGDNWWDEVATALNRELEAEDA